MAEFHQKGAMAPFLLPGQSPRSLIAPLHAPLRLVLDTNTVMALWHFQDPALARLRAHLDLPCIRWLVRDDTIAELDHVLSRPNFGLDAIARTAIVDRYRARAERIEAHPGLPDALPLCRDRDDQKFFEVATIGQAQLLLSRDRLVLRHGRHRCFRDWLRVLTPEQWQRELIASG